MKKIIEYLRLFFFNAQSHKRQRAEIDFRTRDLEFLIPHAKKFVNRYISLFFLLILSSGLSLPGPAITGIIIDKVFISKDATMLNLLVGILLSLLIISEIVRVVQHYFMLRLAQEFIYSVRVYLIERILRYPLSFF